MTSNPKLTIGMPVYNGELFIKKAIESILDQTFTDFELIISNNSSTDSTEKICQDFSKQFDIPLIILRAFNIYGEKIVKGRLISDLIHAVKNNEPLSINDPIPKRDYLYIGDFMALIKKIISSKSPKIGTYNVGHGKSYSNLEVAKIIKGLAGGNLEILINSNPRVNDIIDCTVDTRMIRKTFLWEPKYSLKDGLAKLI